MSARVRVETLRHCLVEDVREGELLGDLVPVADREAAAQLVDAWLTRTVSGIEIVEQIAALLGDDPAGMAQVTDYANLLRARSAAE